jgi:hypothetical protein
MRYAAMSVVYVWRWTFGPLFAGSCKYHPSCSQYALDALRTYGFFRGSVLAGWRLLRCNPWSHGGVDFASDQKVFR